jgi:hypothetical protein
MALIQHRNKHLTTPTKTAKPLAPHATAARPQWKVIRPEGIRADIDTGVINKPL